MKQRNNSQQLSNLMPKLQSSFGFTLLEILMSIAMIAMIAGISMPVYLGFQITNDLDIATNTIAQSCRKAQIMSQGMANDSSWGVEIQTSDITLFQGASYATRDTDYDEIFSLPSSITPSGDQSIVFSKLTGLPDASKAISLTGDNNKVRTLTINSQGIIEY